MKAPEQTHHTPERGAQNINYSMLPPDKLPNWLLEKNAPAKVYNYSMHPPGTQPQVVDYVQESALASREVLMQPPPMPPVPVPVEIVPAAPENIPDAVTTAPEVPYYAPEPADKVSVVAEPHSQVKQEVLVGMESAPVADTDTPNATANKTETIVDVSENRIEPVINWQAPTPPVIQPEPQAAPPTLVVPQQQPQSAGQQEYPSNPRPASNSFADWILNNSNTAMIIVVGIIIFSIVLIILVELGVV